MFERTPAASAGVEVGDEITEVDGHAVTSLGQFRAALAGRAIGRAVPFTIVRAQTARSVPIAIAERPDLAAMATRQLLGRPAPDFALTSLDGRSLSLAALRGSVIVLDFWATWCVPCELAHPLLVAVHARHPGVVMIGISDEDEQVIRDHGASPYPLARDATSAVARDYLVAGIPQIVLIDPRGVVRFIGGGIDAAQRLEAELAKL